MAALFVTVDALKSLSAKRSRIMSRADLHLEAHAAYVSRYLGEGTLGTRLEWSAPTRAEELESWSGLTGR